MGTFTEGDKVVGLRVTNFRGHRVTPETMHTEYGIVMNGEDNYNVQVYNKDKSDWYPYLASDLTLYKEKEMTEFKIGDRVKSRKGNGTVRNIGNSILVQHDSQVPSGHDGNSIGTIKVPKGTGYWFSASDLTKLENEVKTVTLRDAKEGVKLYFKKNETAEDFGCLYIKGAKYIIKKNGGGYDGYNADNKKVGSCTGCLESVEFNLGVNTMDTLQPGDKITNQYGEDEKEVVLANSEYVLTKDIYDGTNDLYGYTVEELTRLKFKIVGAEEEITEVTLEEIAKLKGIDVKQLRIKE